jgi:hydroxymethylglutaryl-CoA reductase
VAWTSPLRRVRKCPLRLPSSSRIAGFYRLSIAERRHRLAELIEVTPQAWQTLDGGALTSDTANGMIENVIGEYALPFAVALNFVIDGKPRLIPMAIEEASVVAAASNAAKMTSTTGGFTCETSAPIMVGQVQLLDVVDVEKAVANIVAHKAELLATARTIVPRLVERGGGPLDITVRELSRPPSIDGGIVVVHWHVDCRDAMGANLVNTLCERTAQRLAELGNARIGLRILSNYSDERTIRVRCTASDASLISDEAPDGAEVRKAIASASRFAELDPYRATTHNKGIMNGVDAVLLATGQDWRAVEAGAHAFASRSGVYRPLAVWRDNGQQLQGELLMPMAVGSVGGALHVHPGARMALELAGIATAAELATIVASAGLATNLAALRALATEGIQRGHMQLHARSIARAAGATGELVESIASALAASGEVKLERATYLVAQASKEPT